MSTCVLVTPLAQNIPFIEDADYIGVDAGCLRILEQNLSLCYAIGDFDSMDENQLEQIKQICEVEIHPVMKDETDSELAIRKFYNQYDKVILFGGIKGRLDHTLLNISLLVKHYPKVILMDETQKVILLKKGKHILSSDYKNVSFFVLEESEISLNGFLYELDHRHVSDNDLYLTSNSFVEQQGVVNVYEGCLLCVQSNEK